MFDEKKRRSSLEMDIPGIEHVQNFRVYLLKRAWTFGFLCGKQVKSA